MGNGRSADDEKHGGQARFSARDKSADGGLRRRSDSEWRAILTPEEFEITRRKGTERPFTGEYHATTAPGTYRCRCCGAELFTSESKFDSGCGWPSFDAAKDANAVVEAADHSHGMTRTEILCHHCDAHLGHVFNDGPTATGLRYCVNSASIRLDPASVEKSP